MSGRNLDPGDADEAVLGSEIGRSQRFTDLVVVGDDDAVEPDVGRGRAAAAAGVLAAPQRREVAAALLFPVRAQRRDGGGGGGEGGRGRVQGPQRTHHAVDDAARRRGVDLSGLRARRVRAEDFKRFDYVLAMDLDNYRSLQEICPPGYESRLHLLMEFATDSPEREVPDPYYGGPSGFDRVFDMVENASQGLLTDILHRHVLGAARDG